MCSACALRFKFLLVLVQTPRGEACNLCPPFRGFSRLFIFSLRAPKKEPKTETRKKGQRSEFPPVLCFLFLFPRFFNAQSEDEAQGLNVSLRDTLRFSVRGGGRSIDDQLLSAR